jgi:hypothetical protein
MALSLLFAGHLTWKYAVRRERIHGFQKYRRDKLRREDAFPVRMSNKFFEARYHHQTLTYNT